jgi:hypothetical protein
MPDTANITIINTKTNLPNETAPFLLRPILIKPLMNAIMPVMRNDK